jgi:thiol-disulfide isomerase/thioredoxin
MLKRDPVLLIVAAMVGSLLLAFGFSKAREAPTPEILAAAKLRGQMAHEFALSTVDNTRMRLSDLRGHAVVLNFWATWCEPCKVEMPWFVELQKQYGPQGVQIIGVQMNDDAGVQDVASFAKDMGIGYPILVGRRQEQTAIANDYGGIAFLPETVFITRDGKISEKTIGLRSKSEIEESIRKALAGVPGHIAEGPGGQTKYWDHAAVVALRPTAN